MQTPRCVIACGGTIETSLMPGRVLFFRADFDVRVHVALSPAALDMVTLTAMRGVSGEEVYHRNAQFDGDGAPLHLSLGVADAVVVYPATARILAECAVGSVTDPVTRVVAFAPKERVAIAPTVHPQMDPRPYRAHLDALRALGCTVLGGDDMHTDWATVQSWLVARLGLERKRDPDDVVRLDQLVKG